MTPSEAIQRMRQVVRVQHKAWATEKNYVHWLQHYMVAPRAMPGPLSSEQKVERFLTWLAVKRRVSASTQNQAFNALVFFYKEVLQRPLQNVQALRASRPAHLRHAPSLQETRDLLRQVRNRNGYPTNPRAIQQAMGHKSLETTMGYLHGESLNVRSPLETILMP